MPGPKTNERPGTRASIKYSRGSASKARRVLNLIRNKSVGDARDILHFSDTGVSETILKVLNSAIANAEHNDDIPAEELFVAACYADEGPTLKRFRPRARGRATNINKRTSHITIIVARYSEDEIDARRERMADRAGSSAAQAEARRRRVARSQAAADADAPADAADASADAAAAAAPTAIAGDDLTVINGIGPAFAEKLAAAGITSVAALANISDDQKAALADDLQGDDMDGWVAQAQDLVAANDDEDAAEALESASDAGSEEE